MADDALDRMWGDSPDPSENEHPSSSSPHDRRQRSQNGDPGQRQKQSGGEPNRPSRRVDDRRDNRSGSRVQAGSPREQPGGRGESTPASEPGPADKEEIPTRKKQFVIREDQDRALNRALAAESCEYGDNRSDIIQSLLDLHGFHE